MNTRNDGPIIFATFTLVYGITLIRKIQNLKDNLEQKDKNERDALSNVLVSSIGSTLDESVDNSQDSEVVTQAMSRTIRIMPQKFYDPKGFFLSQYY